MIFAWLDLVKVHGTASAVRHSDWLGANVYPISAEWSDYCNVKCFPDHAAVRV